MLFVCVGWWLLHHGSHDPPKAILQSLPRTLEAFVTHAGRRAWKMQREAQLRKQRSSRMQGTAQLGLRLFEGRSVVDVKLLKGCFNGTFRVDVKQVYNGMFRLPGRLELSKEGSSDVNELAKAFKPPARSTRSPRSPRRAVSPRATSPQREKGIFWRP